MVRYLVQLHNISLWPKYGAKFTQSTFSSVRFALQLRKGLFYHNKDDVKCDLFWFPEGWRKKYQRCFSWRLWRQIRLIPHVSKSVDLSHVPTLPLLIAFPVVFVLFSKEFATNVKLPIGTRTNSTFPSRWQRVIVSYMVIHSREIRRNTITVDYFLDNGKTNGTGNHLWRHSHLLVTHSKTFRKKYSKWPWALRATSCKHGLPVKRKS